MPQLFPRSSNSIARLMLAGFFFTAVGGAWGAYRLFWSPLQTQVDQPLHQPVPFSHKHHVGQLGIDCRYCHGGAETTRFAGMPPTETCMTCHSQVWRDAPVLEPVRASWRDHRPLRWNRVNDLPDYTYFDHHIHVAKGIACTSCHGDVAEMPLTWKHQTLAMRWCLECHQHPENEVRPLEQLFQGAHSPPPNKFHQAELVRSYGIDTSGLGDCSVCHR